MSDEKEPRAKRETDGDTVLTLQIKKKYIVAIMGLLATPGGIAAWKSFNAEETAQQANNKANVVEDKADVQEDTDYRIARDVNSMRTKLNITSQEAVQCRIDLEQERLRTDYIWNHLFGGRRKNLKKSSVPSVSSEKVPAPEGSPEPLDKKEKSP